MGHQKLEQIMRSVVELSQKDVRLEAILTAGDIFGELALLHNAPRASTIRCQDECYFGTLSKHDFRQSLSKIWKAQMAEMGDFLQETFVFSNWPK